MSDGAARLLVDCCTIYLCYLCITREQRTARQPPPPQVIYVQRPAGVGATAEELVAMATNGADIRPDAEAHRPLLACSTMARDAPPRSV